MLSGDLYASLTDLSNAGIRLRPVEAVTIVRELALLVLRGELPGVPSAHVVRISTSGGLHVEGPISADDDHAVSRAATLLDSLLPGFDAPSDLRAPGALRLVVARALGTLDLPPYGTLPGFVGDLTRFAASEPATLLAALMASWAQAVAQRDGRPRAAEPEPPDATARESAAVEPVRLDS
jgi:hypothetical protein